MQPTQRSKAWSAATSRSAVRPFVAAALFALMAASGCQEDTASNTNGGPREDGGPDASSYTDGGDDGGSTQPMEGGLVDAGMSGDADAASERAPQPLVNQALWQPVEAADDPFEDRPDSVACPESAFGEEPLGGRLTFYVDTEQCSYLTVSQASRARVAAGDEVVVRFKHFPLTAPGEQSAEAHLAFMLGEQLIAERRVAIPAEDQQYTVTWTATEEVDEGSPVYFHAHNHGQNEYSVLSIEVVPGA